jgi:hypothetical protein
LRIYFKIDKEGNASSVIQENGDKTLRNILEKLSSKNKISNKNFDLYYFVDHVENDTDVDDFDNAINLETPLKFLNNFELDVI